MYYPGMGGMLGYVLPGYIGRYTTLVYIAPYTTLVYIAPYTTLGIPWCIHCTSASPGATSALSRVSGNEALGSNPGIIRKERLPRASELSDV